MLKDFKSEWNAIWTISDGMKPGAAIKDAKIDIPGQIKILKVQVTSYQELVASCAALKKGDEPLGLLAKIEETAINIQAIEEVLISLIALQVEANTNAPKGALMLPKDYPVTLYNPTLEKLSTKISTVVSAMQADILAGGLNTEVETANENMGGVAVKSKVTETNFALPSWYKTK